MAEPPEHVGSQFHGVYEADKSSPLEGTAKHPQGRLFAPIGGYAGDPWKLHPENWMPKVETSGVERMDLAAPDAEGFMRKVPGGTGTKYTKTTPPTAHDDTIAWHGSHDSALPRSDEYEHRQLENTAWGNDDYVDPDLADDDWEEPRDTSVDSQDRPMGEYGSIVGMHFGTLASSMERDPRPFVHPARIPNSTLAQPPRGTFQFEKQGGAIVGGPHKVDSDDKSDTRWTDSAANYSEKGTDLVEQGKTLAYKNDVEDRGSTSFRTSPETARTWSEDVMSSVDPHTNLPTSKYGYKDDTSLRGKPHPALVHLAEAGYDPVVLPKQAPPTGIRDAPMQLDLFDTKIDFDHPLVRENRQRQNEFRQGANWTMRKPAD